MKNEIRKITGKTVIECNDRLDGSRLYKVCDCSYNEEQKLRPIVEKQGFKTYGGDYSFYVY
jgi:hypothetical protein